MWRAVPTALALVCALALAGPAGAVQLEPLPGGFESPVYVTSEPGNADRLYVVEQDGQIRLVTRNGNRLFADLDPVVRSAQDGGGNEEGLLSIAFAPDFATTGLLYAFFTTNSGDLQISELTAAGDSAPPETLRPILTVPHPGHANHNGGQLAFGPDGYLYVSTGDGGGSDDPADNGQDLGVLLGKLLRIDPRPGTPAYAIPPGNPFADVSGRPEIWSYGLRNPFRFSFDRLTGDLAIADVGQAAEEEVNFAPASNGAGRGVNWGWDCREGLGPHPSGAACTGPFAEPVLAYRSDSPRCAITGGYVVRDPGLTELRGRYVYADFCEGRIRSATLALPRALGDRAEGVSAGFVTSFGEDSCGRVYVASRGDSAVGAGPGAVWRIVDGTPTDCSSVTPPPPPPRERKCGPIIRGSKGADHLRGGPGRQELIGLRGDDGLRGEGGRDCVRGGAGRDRIRGGSGRDVLSGGPGGDRIHSRDGFRDRVSCGRGRDRVRSDRVDRLRGCERASKRA